MSKLLNQNTWVCLCGAQMWGRNLNWNTRWLPHRIMGRMSIWSSARGVFEVFSPRWRSVLKRDAKWGCQLEFFGLCVELFNCQPDLETEPRLVALYRSLCLSVFLLGEIADKNNMISALYELHFTKKETRYLKISSIYFYSNSGDVPQFNPQFKFARMRLWFSTRCADIFTLI